MAPTRASTRAPRGACSRSLSVLLVSGLLVALGHRLVCPTLGANFALAGAGSRGGLVKSGGFLGAEGRGKDTTLARAAVGDDALELPSLYVYDHCPFCVRARMIFGLKGIRHNLVWMANDDIQTPSKLVGKKIAPILKMQGGEPAMAESVDIVRRIDEDIEWGPPLLQPPSGREDLQAWTKGVSSVMRLLVRPRYSKGFFPEFAFARSREAFVRNHAVADPETGIVPSKAEWLAMGPDKWNAWYTSHLDNTEALLGELHASTGKLEDLIHSEESVSPGGVGYDDIVFFDRLRGATLIKGLKLGPRTTAYLESMSQRSDVPLLGAIAI